MAVDAAHFALANLELDGRPRVRVRDHLRDVCAFVANVIELQDDRIGLPAVDTWMATEVGPQSQPIFKGGPVTSDSRACDVFLAIGHVPKMLVFSHTWPTGSVACASSLPTNVEMVD